MVALATTDHCLPGRRHLDKYRKLRDYNSSQFIAPIWWLKCGNLVPDRFENRTWPPVRSDSKTFCCFISSLFHDYQKLKISHFCYFFLSEQHFKNVFRDYFIENHWLRKLTVPFYCCFRQNTLSIPNFTLFSSLSFQVRQRPRASYGRRRIDIVWVLWFCGHRLLGMCSLCVISGGARFYHLRTTITHHLLLVTISHHTYTLSLDLWGGGVGLVWKTDWASLVRPQPDQRLLEPFWNGGLVQSR